MRAHVCRRDQTTRYSRSRLLPAGACPPVSERCCYRQSVSHCVPGVAVGRRVAAPSASSSSCAVAAGRRAVAPINQSAHQQSTRNATFLHCPQPQRVTPHITALFTPPRRTRSIGKNENNALVHIHPSQPLSSASCTMHHASSIHPSIHHPSIIIIIIRPSIHHRRRACCGGAPGSGGGGPFMFITDAGGGCIIMCGGGGMPPDCVCTQQAVSGGKWRCEASARARAQNDGCNKKYQSLSSL